VRLRALILLLRYSGLRIRDAVTLSRNLIQDDKFFLYTAKTGTAVYCPFPPFVVEALAAIPASAHFFWSGLSKPKSAVGDWQRSLKRLLIGRRSRWARSFLPRHVFGGTLACGCTDRARFNSLGSSKRAHHREALRAVGSGTAGNNYSRCFGALGRPTNRSKGYTAGIRRMPLM
jgi:hypothetical protein